MVADGMGVVAMLRNFLEGCALANLKFKRIILQTGGKVSCYKGFLVWAWIWLLMCG
jgi:hypothetical protein